MKEASGLPHGILGDPGKGVRSEECLCKITDILTFWEIAGLIPSKMSLEFASSSDRETEKPFLEVRHAVWFLRRSKDFAQKYNVVIRFGD